MFQLQFAPALAETPALLRGFWLTIELTVAAILLGGALGLAAAMARNMGPRFVRWLVSAYVELIRNTPFLVQLYIVFFGLPSVGVRVSAIQASIIAMTINLGAYAAEIFRAGIESIHRSQIEAGASLALTRPQILVHVILAPAVSKVWPSLVSQFILIMLTSSVCSFVSVEELSGAAATIQSATFRSFEVYIIVGAVYLGFAILLKSALASVGERLFRRPGTAPRKAKLAAEPGGLR
ncbi:amino acid ABC transporter permease [Limobrevibacterium gyesilva]|uniref:Amino acid ABC transporter permease n=1 Tax=Limobrevibacterium gyesilva TaxID=2991712 RepID=A0AA41YMX0_9PROT|nr:amino acid ABC transporter permease [Limobrevibacterium gyesilva]MCW3473230.1 amino acid ABC transporter permease [Limobrevibacterium gyesilva]